MVGSLGPFFFQKKMAHADGAQPLLSPEAEELAQAVSRRVCYLVSMNPIFTGALRGPLPGQAAAAADATAPFAGPASGLASQIAAAVPPATAGSSEPPRKKLRVEVWLWFLCVSLFALFVFFGRCVEWAAVLLVFFRKVYFVEPLIIIHATPNPLPDAEVDVCGPVHICGVVFAGRRKGRSGEERPRGGRRGALCSPCS